MLQLPSPRLHCLQIPARGVGVAPNLVLVHGLATSMAFWHPGIAGPLSRAFHLLAYDLRGHGRSDRPRRGYGLEQQVLDLECLLDALDIGQAHLVGHSFGGAIATLFALRQPERVATLTLVDTRLRALQPALMPKQLPGWADWSQHLRASGMQVDPEDPEGGLWRLTAMALQTLASPPPRQEPAPQQADAARGGHASPLRGGRRAARTWLDLLERTELMRELRLPDSVDRAWVQGLRVPLLCVYGSESPTLPTGRALQALLPQARLRVLDGAGHFFPLTYPRRLLRPLVRFLAEHLASEQETATELEQLQAAMAKPAREQAAEREPRRPRRLRVPGAR